MESHAPVDGRYKSHVQLVFVERERLGGCQDAKGFRQCCVWTGVIDDMNVHPGVGVPRCEHAVQAGERFIAALVDRDDHIRFLCPEVVVLDRRHDHEFVRSYLAGGTQDGGYVTAQELIANGCVAYQQRSLQRLHAGEDGGRVQRNRVLIQQALGGMWGRETECGGVRQVFDACGQMDVEPDG